MKNSYIYFHITKDTQEIFYVGQGVGSRAWHFHNRSRIWNNTAKKHGVQVEVVLTGLTKEEANHWERFWIASIGRRDLKEGNLVNLTSGGEGPGDPSPERLQQLKEYATGVKFSDERRRKISEALKAHASKPENRKRMTEMNNQRWADPSYRAATSAAMRKPKTKVACSFCGKQMPKGHLTRYGHFEGKCLST